mgnify:CR=1 FL=1
MKTKGAQKQKKTPKNFDVFCFLFFFATAAALVVVVVVTAAAVA